MSRHHSLDILLVFVLVAVAAISSTWGLEQAPREYSVLAIACSVMAILLLFKIRREREKS